MDFLKTQLMGGKTRMPGNIGSGESELLNSSANKLINDVVKMVLANPNAAVGLVRNSRIPGAEAFASMIPSVVDKIKNLGVNDEQIDELTSMIMNSGSGMKNQNIIRGIQNMLLNQKPAETF
jgi:hypothetical protein